ncbi:MAG: hypothetical protein ACD_47C00125G0001 [uncultured bacterium]|nr:MAG: hypothetical protein ACD_47C00125G0001 [uncultured bacterium]
MHIVKRRIEADDLFVFLERLVIKLLLGVGLADVISYLYVVREEFYRALADFYDLVVLFLYESDLDEAEHGVDELGIEFERFFVLSVRFAQHFAVFESVAEFVVEQGVGRSEFDGLLVKLDHLVVKAFFLILRAELVYHVYHVGLKFEGLFIIEHGLVEIVRLFINFGEFGENAGRIHVEFGRAREVCYGVFISSGG